MKKAKPHIDEEGRYLNVHQAAKIVVGVSEKTLWNWANEGETKFGFKLRTKRVPVVHHRYHSLDEAPPKNPRKDRLLILESDVLTLGQILNAVGSSEPGPWSPSEMANLEATAIKLNRVRAKKLNVPHL
jgi:hypothetical protein